MKNLGSFRLRDAMLLLALAFTASVYAQQATPSSSVPTVNDEMAGMHAKAKVRSTELTVTLGDKTLTISPTDLAAMPHETATVINGHTKASETYSGVPIAAILAKLGLPFEKANEHTLLKTYFVAEGTDGYKVLISSYETLSVIREKSTIVADALDGKPLGNDGVFKLVIPGDTRPQRWVQNLKSLSFRTIE
jgi:hypothetical protein